MTNYYKAFGLIIKSEINLPPFLVSESTREDIAITFGRVKTLFPPGQSSDRAIQLSENEILFFWDQVGWFLINNGSEIIVEPFLNAEEQLIQLPLIGIAFAALLHQRGMFVLHASAVSIEDQAVVFIGNKGRGKSTTSAMLYQRGHRMISDDIVAITSENGINFVIPGFPKFKLLPETVESVFGDDSNSLLPICDGAEKRYRSSSDNFTHNPVPLTAIYALDEGENLHLQLLTPQEAIKELIANTYLARYGKQLLQNHEAINNLKQCTKIINQTSIYRLKRPRSFEMMNELTKLIESNCDFKTTFI